MTIELLKKYSGMNGFIKTLLLGVSLYGLTQTTTLATQWVNESDKPVNLSLKFKLNNGDYNPGGNMLISPGKTIDNSLETIGVDHVQNVLREFYKQNEGAHGVAIILTAQDSQSKKTGTVVKSLEKGQEEDRSVCQGLIDNLKITVTKSGDISVTKI